MSAPKLPNFDSDDSEDGLDVDVDVDVDADADAADVHKPFEALAVLHALKNDFDRGLQIIDPSAAVASASASAMDGTDFADADFGVTANQRFLTETDWNAAAEDRNQLLLDVERDFDISVPPIENDDRQDSAGAARATAAVKDGNASTAVSTVNGVGKSRSAVNRLLAAELIGASSGSDRKKQLRSQLYGVDMKDEIAAERAAKRARRGGGKKRGRGKRQLPPELQNMMRVANNHVAFGDNLKEAAKLCLQVIQKAPGFAEPYQTLASIYDHEGNHQRSFSLLFMAAHLSPKSSNLWIDLGNSRVCTASQKAYCMSQLMTHCRDEITKDDDQLAFVYATRACAYRDLGLVFRFIADAKRAIEKYASLGRVEELLLIVQDAVRVECDRQNFADAAKLLEHVLQLLKVDFDCEHQPAYLWTIMNFYCECLAMDHRYGDIVEKMGRIGGSCKDEIPLELIVRYATAFIHAGEVSSAERVLQQWFSRSASPEEFGDLYIDVGNAYYDQIEFRLALHYYRRLVDPPTRFMGPFVWLRIAHCQSNLHLMDDAIESFRMVLNDVPNNMEARLELARLLESQGRKDELVFVLRDESEMNAAEIIRRLEEKERLLNRMSMTASTGASGSFAARSATTSTVPQGAADVERLKQEIDVELRYLAQTSLMLLDNHNMAAFMEAAVPLFQRVLSLRDEDFQSSSLFSEYRLHSLSTKSSQPMSAPDKTRRKAPACGKRASEKDADADTLDALDGADDDEPDELSVSTVDPEKRNLVLWTWKSVVSAVSEEGAVRMVAALCLSLRDVRSLVFIMQVLHLQLFRSHSSECEMFRILYVQIAMERGIYFQAFLQARQLMRERPSATSAWNLVAKTIRHLPEGFLRLHYRFAARLTRCVEHDPVLSIKSGRVCLSGIRESQALDRDRLFLCARLVVINHAHSAFHRHALGEYYALSLTYPDEPLVQFCLATALLSVSRNKSVPFWNQMALYGLAYLNRSASLRGASHAAESLYNRARYCQALGMNTWAMELYSEILNAPSDSPTLPDVQRVRRESAHNVALMFRSAGNDVAARAVVEKHLSF
eukprot:ANDGO_03446.mRNA.1 transcription factor IIIC-gamma subunit